MNHKKYKAYKSVNLAERKWPNRTIEKAPIWCSVDLRDGNQALETPMNLEQKVNFFKFLVKMGFKEIEIGFPAASETEFAFARKLIEENIIPDDVTVQVLTQAREHIIRKTFEALEGVNKAIVHLYNSTSSLQRKVVFEKSKEEIKALAVEGARFVKNCAEEYGSHRFTFEYSPESFTGTELDYATDVCNAVIDAFKPSKDHKVIINLPSTVEMSTPNVYADQIEYMCGHINQRENVIISLHTHNDRGTGVAASELGILAGADRIEGTLFGNGERTGNADILNLALNMYSQGMDPGLDFSDIERIIEVYENSTMLNVHPRHPYAGKLVYTAFSGSHQDAIKKGFSALKNKEEEWEVPYLPIDPKDLGRNYEAIIRINSQSGKGGVSYILEGNFGLKIPKNMQQYFGNIVTDISDKEEKELMPSDIFKLFEGEYINIASPIDLISYSEKTNGESLVKAVIAMDKDIKEIDGKGNGLIDGFCKAITEAIGVTFEISHYSQHAMEEGSKSRAITYVGIKDSQGKEYFGAGTSESISRSSIKAVVSAVNNMLTKQ